MKNKKIIIIIIGAILLVAGILCFFLWPKKSNKEIYLEAIKNSFGFNAVETKKESLKGKNIHYTLEMEGFGDIDPINAFVTEGKVYFNGTLPASGQEYELEGLFNDDKLYFTIKDLLENYYYVKPDGSDSNSKDEALYDKIGDAIANSVTKTIKSNRVNVEDTTKKINGKEYEVKKYSYAFNGNDLYDIIKYLVEDLKKDKEFMSLIDKDGSFSSISVNDLLENFKSLKSDENLLSYAVFLYKGDVISTDITIYIPTSSGSQKITVPVSVVFSDVDNYYEAYISTMGARICELVIDNTKGSINLLVSGTQVLTGTFNESKITLESTGNFLPEFKIVITREEVKEFPSIDVSKALPYEEMTDKDKTALEIFDLGSSELLDLDDLSLI